MRVRPIIKIHGQAFTFSPKRLWAHDDMQSLKPTVFIRRKSPRRYQVVRNGRIVFTGTYDACRNVECKL